MFRGNSFPDGGHGITSLMEGGTVFPWGSHSFHEEGHSINSSRVWGGAIFRGKGALCLELEGGWGTVFKPSVARGYLKFYMGGTTVQYSK